MNTRTTKATLAALALTALCGMASASIVSVSGNTTLIAPPVACGPTQLWGGTAYAWDEQQGVNVASVFCDETQNPGGSASPTFGVVSGVVDSHFLHFQDNIGVNSSGTVTFNNPIVGVIWKNSLLDLTDASLGSPTTIYPTGYFNRGINALPLAIVTINANVMTFTLGTNIANGDVAQIRVLTQVPAPGAGGLLAGIGLLAARRRR